METAGLKTHFNLTAPEYEHSRRGHLEDRRRGVVEREISDRARPADTVLELGCGRGGLLGRLAAAHQEMTFLGFDVEPKMIDYARSHHLRENLRYDFVDLSWLKEVPRAVRWLEPALERFRVLGGSVVYRLQSPPQ